MIKGGQTRPPARIGTNADAGSRGAIALEDHRLEPRPTPARIRTVESPRGHACHQAALRYRHAHPHRGRVPAALGFHAAAAGQTCARAGSGPPKAWLRDEYPKIVARAKAEDAEIYWGDETAIRQDSHWGSGLLDGRLDARTSAAGRSPWIDIDDLGDYQPGIGAFLLRGRHRCRALHRLLEGSDSGRPAQRCS